MKNARTIVFFCTNLFMLLLLLIIVVDKTAGYNDKYDNFDVDNVLKNNRVMTYYIKCLMEKGPCNNEGKDLKNTIPDAIATNCNKCNEKQKERAKKVINYLIENRKDDWEKLVQKYDPKGEFKKRYEAQGKKI